jgi:simple sugar transport system permease protein
MNLPFDLFTPLLLAALGALFSERAGLLNIALEGQMLGGAFTAILVQQLTGNLALTVLAVTSFGALSSLVLAWGTLKLKADPFIAALGLNLLVPALTGWVSFLLFGNLGVIRLATNVAPRWEGIPVTFLLALALAGLAHFVLFHTSWGLRLRSAGASEHLMASRSLGTRGIKTAALVISGVLGAVGGAVLALNLGALVQGVSARLDWVRQVRRGRGHQGLVFRGPAHCRQRARVLQRTYPRRRGRRACTGGAWAMLLQLRGSGGAGFTAPAQPEGARMPSRAKGPPRSGPWPSGDALFWV